MVAPIYIIAIALAAGFSLGIVGKANKKFAFILTMSALAVALCFSVSRVGRD